MKTETTHRVGRWSITPTTGVGRGPCYSPITCFIIIGPYVKTETRVDANGLKDMLPARIHARYMALSQEATT